MPQTERITDDRRTELHQQLDEILDRARAEQRGAVLTLLDWMQEAFATGRKEG